MPVFRHHSWSCSNDGSSISMSVVAVFADNDGDRDFRYRPMLEFDAFGGTVNASLDEIDRMIETLTKAKALQGACADTGIGTRFGPCAEQYGHDGDHVDVDGDSWPRQMP